MSIKNLRKYICNDCNYSQMLNPYVFSLANKPHCTNCGSTFLELSKLSHRRDEEKDIGDIKRSGKYSTVHKKQRR